MLLPENPTTAILTCTADEPVQVVDYSRALRVIGQDLTPLFPRVIEIETDGVNFTARGQSHHNPFHTVRKSTFKKIWHKLIGRRAEAESIALAPSADSFRLTYTPTDIDRLDRLYIATRSGQAGRPDSYCLAERLRAMGGIVNSRNGRLKQLRKNADNLFVDYWDQNGEMHTAKLTTVILYRNQQHQLSHSPTPKELWEGYDF